MLLSPYREALLSDVGSNRDVQVATARSFGYEWQHFSEMRPEWEKNFWGYMQPHRAEFFRGKRILDAGCGTGRHTYYAAKFGAEVWAVDLGDAVEVARRNTVQCTNVSVVQADLYRLPFEEESFDFVYSIGVLHHLPDPEGGFRNLLRYVRPGGQIQVYLYWRPENQPVKAALLAGVTAVRRLTTRMPHPLLHALSYFIAVGVFAAFVVPYRILHRISVLRSFAERLPMRQYSEYPFGVCVNDQFDRFSAPIENRYTRAEVLAWFERGGLEDVHVIPHWGWVATGRKPIKKEATHTGRDAEAVFG